MCVSKHFAFLLFLPLAGAIIPNEQAKGDLFGLCAEMRRKRITVYSNGFGQNARLFHRQHGQEN